MMSLYKSIYPFLYLYLFGEGGREHHCLSVTNSWHGVLFNNPSDLWLKAHVKHPVCLIQHKPQGICKSEEIAQKVYTHVYIYTTHTYRQ